MTAKFACGQTLGTCLSFLSLPAESRDYSVPAALEISLFSLYIILHSSTNAYSVIQS